MTIWKREITIIIIVTNMTALQPGHSAGSDKRQRGIQLRNNYTSWTSSSLAHSRWSDRGRESFVASGLASRRCARAGGRGNLHHQRGNCCSLYDDNLHSINGSTQWLSTQSPQVSKNMRHSICYSNFTLFPHLQQCSTERPFPFIHLLGRMLQVTGFQGRLSAPIQSRRPSVVAHCGNQPLFVWQVVLCRPL